MLPFAVHVVVRGVAEHEELTPVRQPHDRRDVADAEGRVATVGQRLIVDRGLRRVRQAPARVGVARARRSPRATAPSTSAALRAARAPSCPRSPVPSARRRPARGETVRSSTVDSWYRGTCVRTHRRRASQNDVNELTRSGSRARAPSVALRACGRSIRTRRRSTRATPRPDR